MAHLYAIPSLSDVPAAAGRQVRTGVSAADKALEATLRSKALDDPSTLAESVLKLHNLSDWDSCGGCDPGEFAASYPSWPCSTVILVAAHLGMKL